VKDTIASITNISDHAFANELDGHLKKQNITKRGRGVIIHNALMRPLEDRDAILDAEEYKAKAKQVKLRVPLEKTEQINFVHWFKETYHEIKIMMIRNDGKRTFAEKPEQMLMGLLPGASDLYIPEWHCWVEMKRVKNSTWSIEQQDFCYYVRRCCDTYLLCYGFEDAKRQIKQFVMDKGLNYE
jgi:hypothetical protein